MGARGNYDSSRVEYVWNEYESSKLGLTVLAITGHP